MESISVSGEVGGAGGAYSYDALKRLDQIWSNICSTQTGKSWFIVWCNLICSYNIQHNFWLLGDLHFSFAVQQEIQQVVSSNAGLFSQSDLSDKAVGTFDVIVCGGTLGIFIATALSFKGLRVAIVERNTLKGVYWILKLIIESRHSIWSEKTFFKISGVLTDVTSVFLTNE